MHYPLNCRARLLLLPCLIILLSLFGYICWPWLHAAWLWRTSTIGYPLVSALNHTGMSVPAIIHQTWRDRDTIPLSWQQASNSCRALHPNYEYRFWTDADARRLVEKEFPDLLWTFDAYPYDIQRADVIRLVALYVYGGIYLDLDIICLQSLDPLRTYQLVLPKTMPVGLSNDFMVACPRHPFLLQLLNNLPKANRNYLAKYATVMFSTGPMFLTGQASSYANRSSLDVLAPDLYGKYKHNSTRALFRHLKASSWHGNDAALIKWIYRRRAACLSLLSITFLLTFALIYLVQHRHTLTNPLGKFPSLGGFKSKGQPVQYERINSDVVAV